MHTCVIKTLVKSLDSIIEHEIYWHVLWKKLSFSCKPPFIFIFYCGTVSRETGEKIAACSTIFVGSKMKLSDGFMN